MLSNTPATERQWKLNYEIKGRRPLHVPGINHTQPTDSIPDRRMEMIDIIWTHKDGFPCDQRDIAIHTQMVDMVVGPLLSEAVKQNLITEEVADRIEGIRAALFHVHSQRPELSILTIPDGERPFIGDQLNVPEGTPTSMILLMLEEKRPALARALGVEP